jgi:hypothetical protein
MKKLYHDVQTCFCDDCIKQRVILKREKAEFDKQAQSYIARRGGEIGSISLSEAKKGLK